MRAALFSDAHFRGPDDPNQQLFVRFIEKLDVDRICLLGDIFHHWWDYADRPFPVYQPVVDALTARGLPLIYVPGNHDWRAPRWFQRHMGATIGQPIRETWDGLRVHLSHGDEADTSLGYAALSFVLRGQPFAAWMALRGPEYGWNLLERLAGHGEGAPANLPLCEKQKLLAAKLLSGEPDLVVFGHTHVPGVFHYPGGTYVNLGDWVTHHTWLYVENGEVELRHAER